MYAVIETGGKQYRVSEGDTLFIEKVEVEDGKSLVFDKVLAVSDESGLKVGKPYVEGAKVDATVEKNGKGKKILIFKYKAKKTEKKMMGHRQPYTKVMINKITL
ncbi:MAG: 50S ribosomal protein L21 [Clostridia bacterium]|jgi:large subunit ribosomal protein L21